MNIRYQIFVSSTYIDLKDERKFVIDELVRVGYIAIGMEQFPAANEDQMEYICPVIDESDYYIIIIKGKYGSLAVDGISYTQKECEYAALKEKPVLVFVYKDYDKLTTADIEQTPEMLTKFLAFKESLISSKIVKFWSDKQELASGVKDSIFEIVRRRPAPGWIRGDNAVDPKVFKQLEELRIENADLKAKLEKLAGSASFDKNLGQGKDKVFFDYRVLERVPSTDTQDPEERVIGEHKYETTWDGLVNALAEKLYQEPSEEEIFRFFYERISRRRGLSKSQFIEFDDDIVRTMRFQLEALGLIETFTDIREDESLGFVTTRKTKLLCWKFSEFGKNYIAKLNAIARADNADEPGGVVLVNPKST